MDGERETLHHGLTLHFQNLFNKGNLILENFYILQNS